jgi:transposase
MPLPSPPHGRSWRRWGKKVRQDPEHFELHYQDETHLETNPSLCRVWHRRGHQATLPGVGTNRRLTVFGSVEALGRGRIELVRAGQDSAGFVRYLELLEAWHHALHREMYLVLDNGSAHTSTTSQHALAQRHDWLHVLWLAKYAPQLNPKEREWRWLKRDARSHLAPTLRAFVDGIVQGLERLGGTRLDIVDEVPDWFLEGHRQPPTGRRSGRPKGAKDSYKRAPYRHANLPTHT